MCQVFSPIIVLLFQGPIISAIVDFLKRQPIVREHPQAAVAILNAAATLLAGTVVCGLDIGTILGLAAAGFASSVTTHEVVSQFIKRKVETAGERADDRTGLLE